LASLNTGGAPCLAVFETWESPVREFSTSISPDRSCAETWGQTERSLVFSRPGLDGHKSDTYDPSCTIHRVAGGPPFRPLLAKGGDTRCITDVRARETLDLLRNGGWPRSLSGIEPILIFADTKITEGAPASRGFRDLGVARGLAHPFHPCRFNCGCPTLCDFQRVGSTACGFAS
jgi:hypothetical protein